MTSSRCLLALALLHLGCAAETPAPTHPGATGAAAQPASEVAVVDVNAPPPTAPTAPKSPTAPTAPTAAAKAEPPQEKTAEAPSEVDDAEEGKRASSSYGVIGALKATDEGNVAILGTLSGDSVGEAFGVGGLGLTGTGVGAGGTGTGTLGLGSIGTLGHGSGAGQGQGFGSGGSSKGASPKITVGAAQVAGRLPPEVIQRIVRQHFGQLRLCYDKGLKNNPSLAGQVKVRFIIDLDGSVKTASNDGSDIGDASVASCVVNVFKKLSFPQPESGLVMVTYPLRFAPGDAAPAAAKAAPAKAAPAKATKAPGPTPTPPAKKP